MSPPDLIRRVALRRLAPLALVLPAAVWGLSSPFLLSPLLSAEPIEPPEPGDPPELETEGTLRLLASKFAAVGGETLEFALGVHADDPLEQVAFSLEFDAERLEFVEMLLDPGVRAGPHTRFRSFHDEGTNWVQGVLELEPELDADSDIEFEGAEDEHVVQIRFRVLPGAPEGDARVGFALPQDAAFEGHLSDDGTRFFYNTVRVKGQGDPATSTFFEGVKAPAIPARDVRVNILGDVGLFSRGDANLDGRLDLSDAVFLLSYLYLDGQEPQSLAAADVNRDDRVDIGDPLALLFALFFQFPGS